MPTYSYRCANHSDHVFEVTTSIARRNDIQQCPECGGDGKHIITPVAFKLPGHRSEYPTAADKWAREHERAREKEKQKEVDIQKDLNSSMY